MVAPRIPRRPTRIRATNCCAVKAANAASNVRTSAPSRPVAASRRSFDFSSVRRNTGSDGRSTLRGCGSKVMAIAGASSAAARASAMSITARWPRCTPSKLPIAATAPLNRATRGASSRTTRNGSLDLEEATIRRDALGGEPAALCATKSTLLAKPRRHGYQRFAVEHQLAVDACLAVEAYDPPLRHQFDDFDHDLHHVANLHGTVEIQRLRAINGTRTGQAGAKHGRD